MDNVPAHKVEEIEPLILSKGASLLYQSPYSLDFNPIEHWWSQLKAFLRSFSPTTTKMVDVLQHFRLLWNVVFLLAPLLAYLSDLRMYLIAAGSVWKRGERRLYAPDQNWLAVGCT